ncbi:TPA: hypothetical protein IRA89_004839, partial [Escherichia coli]|nr:hypothetical protein [Escherichia coli]
MNLIYFDNITASKNATIKDKKKPLGRGAKVWAGLCCFCFLGFVCDFLVAGCRFRSGFGHFTFFAFAVGGNASPFLDADDSTGQLDEALLPLVSGVGALLAGQGTVAKLAMRQPFV